MSFSDAPPSPPHSLPLYPSKVLRSVLKRTKPAVVIPAGLSAVVPTGTLIEAVPPISRVVCGDVELTPTLVVFTVVIIVPPTPTLRSADVVTPVIFAAVIF